MTDDIYKQAYREGGVEAVNALLKELFPDMSERVRATEAMEKTGFWEIDWDYSSRNSDGRDLGRVKAYLGYND
ncbi:hypothetical protein [Mesorhizobium sp. M1409]|uniref:hypothetical protein n=1 Tax=unclassified Mesorhizobium TaxID=325217 RepID=UPI0033369B15